MFEDYRKFQAAQRTWIRNHPAQYVILNVTLLGVWVGYVEYRDRKELREIENEIAQQNA